jgi:hypothetical protein
MLGLSHGSGQMEKFSAVELELDAARAVARYHFGRGRASARKKWAGVFAMVVFMSINLMAGAFIWHVGIIWLAHVLVASLVAGAVVASDTARISVGADALRIQIPFRPTRTLRYVAVAAVSHAGANVAIELKNGETLRFGGVGTGREHRALLAANAADFAARVGSRLRAQASRVDDPSDVLRRAGRATDAWLRDLEALRQPGSYRVPVTPDDVLWRVAEDPFAPPDARAGAAFALRPSLDEAVRARIRVAADACAAPELRAAFEAIASEGDLARALDRLGA